MDGVLCTRDCDRTSSRFADPASPRVVGYNPPTASPARHLELRGGRACRRSSGSSGSRVREIRLVRCVAHANPPVLQAKLAQRDSTTASTGLQFGLTNKKRDGELVVFLVCCFRAQVPWGGGGHSFGFLFRVFSGDRKTK